MNDIYRKQKKSIINANLNEDSDHYGYNDSNTSIKGEIDGLPMQASNLNNIVKPPTFRKKKIEKPKLRRRIKKSKILKTKQKHKRK